MLSDLCVGCSAVVLQSVITDSPIIYTETKDQPDTNDSVVLS